MMTNITVFPGP